MRRNFKTAVAGAFMIACLAACRGGNGEIQALTEPENRETENVETEVPAADDQSNFGSGYGYQRGPEEGTVEIDVDGRWMVFEQRDGESGQVYFEGQWYDTADLSEETLEWLVMYNRLPEEDQLALNHIPLELWELSGMAEEDGRTQETNAFRNLTELNDMEIPDEEEDWFF